jgi:hypothetical protein
MSAQKEKTAETAGTVRRSDCVQAAKTADTNTYGCNLSVAGKTQICKNKFQTVDAETLLTSPLQSINFVIDQFLSQGVHILAGAPKIGKSWLALWLCIRVAKGESVWNFCSDKGTVLYLCLEDNQNRIQNRLFDVADWCEESDLSNLHFTTKANIIGSDLEAQIENFCKEHLDTKLIVIDTLQKIRTVSNDNAYANDYRDLTALKTLADKFEIAILLIHHLRKQADNDPFNRISGTTGISGAVDSSFVLEKDKRSSNKATLYCVGRDIEQRELSLEFDANKHIWNLIADSIEQPMKFIDDTIFLLSDVIKSVGYFQGTASELIELLKLENMSPSVLAKRIVKNSTELEKLGIHFESRRTGQFREILLNYDGNDTNDGKRDMS